MKYILMACFMALGSTSWAAKTEQLEGFTAKLFTAKGTVEYLKAGTADWKAVKAPFMLEMGDQVRTGAKGKAEIYMRYGAKVRLDKDTHFEVSKVAPEGNVVQVLRGKMHAWVRKFKGRGFTVRTPSAVCAVRGTTFSVTVPPGAALLFDLYGGGLEVTDMRNNSVILQPGQRLELNPSAVVPPVPVAIPPGVSAPAEPAAIKEEKAEIKAEQIIIQQQAAAAAAAVVEPQPDAEPIQEEVVVQEPVTTVIPTATVQESQEVSGSTPDEGQGPDAPPAEEPPQEPA